MRNLLPAHIQRLLTLCRRTLVLAALPPLALMAAACDPCNDTQCLNGGSCYDGTCQCAYPFEGDRCQSLEREKFVGRYDITYRGSLYKSSLAAPSERSYFDFTLRNQFVAADAAADRIVIPNFLGVTGQNARFKVFGNQLRVDSEAFYTQTVDTTTFTVRFPFSGSGVLTGRNITLNPSTLPSFDYDGCDIEIILNKLD